MNSNNQLCIKIIHCGNINITNPEDREQKNVFYMPMGLIPMADKLHKSGFDAEVIHMDLEASRGIDAILDFDTVDVVGFDDHWVNQSLVVMDTAALIKKKNPGIFVVLGGFTASLFAHEIVTHFPQVDGVIRGDGEVPFVQLAEALQGERAAGQTAELQNVQNLVWRAGDGSVIENEFSYIGTPAEMEKLDFAAVERLRNWQAYRLSSTFHTNFKPFDTSPMFLLEVGRGCDYACTFCGGNCEAQRRMNNRPATKMRSVDSVLETVRRAVDLEFETFYTCLEYEGSDEWFARLFRRIKEEGIDINFIYGSWRLPSMGLLEAFAQCFNDVLIEISPETSNIELRKKNKDMRLFYTNEQIEECLDFCNKHGIKVQLFFGYYLEGDTERTVWDTTVYSLELLTRYPDILEMDYYNFSTDPGSLFFFFPEKFDIKINVRNFRDYMDHLKESYVLKKGQRADMTLYKPGSMSDDEDREIRRWMAVLNYLFLYYRKSLSYMLRKVEKPETVLALVKETGINVSSEKEIPPEKMRKELLSGCEKYNLLDDSLIRLIGLEWEKVNSQHLVSKPTIPWYLDFEEQGIEGETEVYGSMVNYINSRLGEESDAGKMDVEFDI